MVMLLMKDQMLGSYSDIRALNQMRKSKSLSLLMCSELFFQSNIFFHCTINALVSTCYELILQFRIDLDLYNALLKVIIKSQPVWYSIVPCFLILQTVLR